MKVLVTGATGHLGTALVRALLDAGRPVRAMVHDTARGLPREVERVRGDVRDPRAVREAVEGCGLVHHLAAMISLFPWDFDRMRRVNHEGAVHVAEACRATGARMVHYSSIHAYRPDELDAVVDESRDYAMAKELPAYDRTKALGSLGVDTLTREGLDAVTLHPTGVLGPYDPGTSKQGAWLRRVAAGREPVLVHGSFDWVDVRDVISSGISAEDPARAPRGEHYLLGNRHASMVELATMAARASGRSPPRWAIPLSVAAFLAPGAELMARASGMNIPLNRAAVHALKTHRRVSHEKASRCLGHAPRALEDTVRDAVEWYREQGTLK